MKLLGKKYARYRFCFSFFFSFFTSDITSYYISGMLASVANYNCTHLGNKVVKIFLEISLKKLAASYNCSEGKAHYTLLLQGCNLCFLHSIYRHLALTSSVLYSSFGCRCHFSSKHLSISRFFYFQMRWPLSSILSPWIQMRQPSPIQEPTTAILKICCRNPVPVLLFPFLLFPFPYSERFHSSALESS